MSELRITIWSITENPDGAKSINYSVAYPDGRRMIGASVPLGGQIVLAVNHREPTMTVSTDKPVEARTDED